MKWIKMQSIIADVTADEEKRKKYDPTNPRLYLVKGITFYITCSIWWWSR